jgi:hypothetical protein
MTLAQVNFDCLSSCLFPPFHRLTQRKRTHSLGGDLSAPCFGARRDEQRFGSCRKIGVAFPGTQAA